MTLFNPTDKQKEAIASIDTDMPVTAGAGSGKTFVLTHRYLQILAESDADLDEILTITFTEKAANQMKKKIRDLITTFARGERVKGFPPVFKPDLKFPSRNYWQNLLDRFEETYISTIHGFCSRMLRERATEIGLDPEFQVMDDHALTLKRPEIVRRTIFRMIKNEDRYISHWLNYFSLFQILENMNGMISGRIQYDGLVEFYKSDENSGTKNIDSLLQQSKNFYGNRIKPVLQQLDEAPHREYIFSTIRVFSPQDHSDVFYPHYLQLRKAIELLETSPDEVEQFSAWLDIRDNLKSKGKKANWQETNFTEFKKEMITFRDNVLAPVTEGLELFDETVERKAIELAVAGTAIFDEVQKSYQSWKEQYNYLDYDDLLINAVQMLKEYPNIRKDFADQFKHILVDEFQDTNPIQFELIELLRNAETPGTKRLFLVGDPKQSIYRFRGTDVTLFQQAKTDLQKEDTALSISFRSQPALLDWYDSVFSTIMGSDDKEQKHLESFEQLYSSLTSNRENIHSGPHITLNLVEARSEYDEDDASNRAQLEAAYIAQWIQKNLNQMEVESDGTIRNAEYGDIAILFRRTTHLKQFEYVLNLANIPYYTVGGSGFFQKQEILDILNILKSLINSRDDISLVGALRSGFFGVSDEGLLRLAMEKKPWKNYIFDEDSTIPASLSKSDRHSLNSARRILQKLHSIKDRVNPGRIIEMLGSETGYLGIVGLGDDGLQKVRNVEQFIHFAYDFGRNTGPSLHEFVQYVQSLQTLSDQEEALLHSGEQNAVQLMTIHKSKGLEFPIVILPQIESGSGSSRLQKDFYPEIGWALKWNDPERELDAQEVQPFLYSFIRDLERKQELAESKRLFYVGNTRARDHLMLSGVVNLKGGLVDAVQKVDYSKDNWFYWILGILVEKGWEPGNDTLKLEDCLVDIRTYSHLGVDTLPPATDILRKRYMERTDVDELSNQLEASEITKRWKTPETKPDIEEIKATMLRDFADEENRKNFYEKYILNIPATSYDASHDCGKVTGTEFGSISHHLFERYVKNMDPDVEKFVGTNLGSIREKSRNEVYTELVKIFEKFRNSQLFDLMKDRQPLTEVPFLCSIAGKPLIGQIDLLLRSTSGDNIIIDYKSDDVEESELSDKNEFYKPQLCAYAYAIRKIMNKSPERVYLYYMRTGTMQELQITESDILQIEDTAYQLLDFIQSYQSTN